MTSAGLIDSHCHLDIIQPNPAKLSTILDTCLEYGLTHIVHISTSLESFLTVAPYTQKYPKLLSLTLGFMPGEDISMIDYKFMKIIEEKQICAIGEIGLDYYRDTGPKDKQIALFEKQCAFAVENDLPVVLHNREADSDLLEVLSGFSGIQGVLHCFTGGPEMAEKILDLGLSISFSGIVTFRNAQIIRDAALMIPKDKILVETDSPYLAPVPVRGEQNFPWNVQHTARFLAELRGERDVDFFIQTANNAKSLFRIEP